MRYKDIRQSEDYGQFMKKIGWSVENLADCQIFIKKLPFLGSIIKIQRPQNLPFREIETLRKKYQALFLKIEPKNLDKKTSKQLNIYGYRLSKSPLLPTKTIQIDLKQKLEKIFANFKKDCRYEIRKAKKNKIIIKDSSNIEIFIKLWHQAARKRNFFFPSNKEITSLYDVFKKNKNAFLLLAFSFNNPLAGILILIYNKIAYYFYAASTSEGKKLSAPYLLVWEAIKKAKKQSCQIFDFEGIYDSRFPIKSWLGFSHFKKSFSGQEIEYPGCFIKCFNPFLKPIFYFF